MKRILLVDDDFLALNAFFTLADWNQYGLSIAFEAHNGQEALDYLKDNRPDIAFLDVCMPDMDGIALLRLIRARDPSILCIMLSSYSDYPYVREALKHGAADYLLKHEITRESVLRLLSQYVTEIAPAPSGEDLESRLLHVLGERRPDAEPLSGILSYGCLASGRIPIEAQLMSIHQTCRHILNECPGSAVSSPDPGELVLFFPPANLEQAQEYTAKIRKAMEKYHHMEYAFLPVKHCADAEQINQAYRLFHRESIQNAPARPSLSSEESISLMLAVINHQKAMVKTLVQALYADAQKKKDVDAFAREVLSLYQHLKQLMGITGSVPPRLPGDPAQWEAAVEKMFVDLSAYDDAGASSPCSHTIRQALEYLHQHYAEDIRLNDVARYCNVSYNHLSFLFKKETGENIVGYINRLRIHQAARLILFDSLPVSAVCEKVGFNSYNHFFATFRSITGMTPSEFRKNAQAVEWMIQSSQAIRGVF